MTQLAASQTHAPIEPRHSWMRDEVEALFADRKSVV